MENKYTIKENYKDVVILHDIYDHEGGFVASFLWQSEAIDYVAFKNTKKIDIDLKEWLIMVIKGLKTYPHYYVGVDANNCDKCVEIISNLRSE